LDESILGCIGNDEVLTKWPLEVAQSSFRGGHRLRLLDGVFGEAAFIEPFHHIPAETFSCAVSVRQGQVEKSLGSFTNGIGIEFHGAAAALRTRTRYRSRLAEISSADRL
jgi:hypothetical protein